jgi:hypothetical protein
MKCNKVQPASQPHQEPSNETRQYIYLIFIGPGAIRILRRRAVSLGQDIALQPDNLDNEHF